MEMAVRSDNIRTALPWASIPCCGKPKGRTLCHSPACHTFEMGGQAKRCPGSEEERQLLGSKCPSLGKNQCWDFFLQRKEFGLPTSDTGRIRWVYVKFFV